MPSGINRMVTPKALKHYLFLLLFALLIQLIFSGVNKIFPGFFPSENIPALTGGFALISLTALIIFFSGYGKNAEKSVFATFIAIGVKMILSFVFALVFLVIFKNRETGSVVLFFVIYLVFAIFTFSTFFSILKKKSM
jgi:hypothetical protein